MRNTRALVGGGLLLGILAGCGGQIGGDGQGGSSGGATIATGKGGGGSGGGGVGGGPDETVGSGGDGTGGHGGSQAGGAGGAPLVACNVDNPVFPDFDKTCAETADCALVFHQVNCCGTRRAIGIAASEVPAFEAAEATCEGQYPPCKCLQLATKAEDDEAGDEASMMVECASGKCLSYVP